MELSKLQTEILNHPSNRSVIIASAAAGKTTVMTEKVRQLLQANIDPRQIAVITFTNMAAAELRDRLGEDYKNGLFVGTVHALANYMLNRHGISTQKILKDEEFDELFKLIKENPNSADHYEWILLDEAQDCDILQFEFIFKYINPDYFFLVGDPKQCIYQFNGSRPDLIMKIANLSDVTAFDLNENYRNGYNILRAAKDIITPTGLIDNSLAMRKGNGTYIKVPYSLNTIVDKLDYEPNLNSWAILCRTNKEVSTISSYLKKNCIACETFHQKDLSKEELQEKMSNNTVKVLTIHASKGLEWDKVIVVGARLSNLEERNVSYVAATRAKEELIWMYTPKKQYGYRY